jgi:ApeA-like protein/HEPN superfamily Apea-like protein
VIRALPLDEPAEIVGEWWVPTAADRTASGRLIYQPFEPLRLELVSGGGIFDHSQTASWVHGLSVEGRFITLHDLVIDHWSLNIPGGVVERARVEEAFVGMYASSESNLRLDSISARITNLTPWLDPAGLGASRRGAVVIKSSSVTGLGRAPGGLLATGWVEIEAEAEPERKPLRLELQQQGWVSFAARRRLRWEQFHRALWIFREFISLSAGVDSPLLEVRGSATVVRETFGSGPKYRTKEPVWILFRQRRTTEVRETPANEMLFRQAEAAFSNHRPLMRWFRRASHMEPIYDLYVAALPPRSMFLEQRFLSFAQALEAYDFRRTGNERKLIKVVRSAVENLPAGLKKHVPPSFPALVRDTRHYLTHFNPKYEPSAAKDEQLYAATSAMKLLFELTMLLELGFGKQRIEALVDKNPRLQKELQLGFCSL